MLNSILTSTITATQFAACLGTSLGLGFAIALLHSFQNRSSRNFLLTLVILPAVVMAVILLVNGNVGAGVAVAGTFSLVRFRSVPGNAREITSVFLAMAVGLACGMGCRGIAALLTVVVGLVTILLVVSPMGKSGINVRELRITIPENLDYSGIFDDLFDKYTSQSELIRVKTVNMGSLYELVYHITLKDSANEKDLIDDARVRNGNLEIVLGRIAEKTETL